MMWLRPNLLRPMGSLRNFSSTSVPTGIDSSKRIARLKVGFWIVSRGIGFAIGCGYARYALRDPASILKEERQKELKNLEELLAILENR